MFVTTVVIAAATPHASTSIAVRNKFDNTITSLTMTGNGGSQAQYRASSHQSLLPSASRQQHGTSCENPFQGFFLLNTSISFTFP